MYLPKTVEKLSVFNSAIYKDFTCQYVNIQFYNLSKIFFTPAYYS